MPTRPSSWEAALIVGVVVVIALIGALALGVFGGAAPLTATPTVTPTRGPVPTSTSQPPTATGGAPTSTPEGPTATSAPTQPPPTATPTLQATANITPTATSEAVVTVQLGGNTELGPFVVDVNGMTLYTFSQDTSTTSACTGECATNWPPLIVAPGTQLVAGEGLAGQLATIPRDDGTLQVTYNGHPLYRYKLDTAPGDAKGHGIANQWFVATP